MSLDKITRKIHIKILFKFIQVFIEYMSKELLLKKNHLLEIRPEGPSRSACFWPSRAPCALLPIWPAVRLLGGSEETPRPGRNLGLGWQFNPRARPAWA
jgi:hypothetical protein